MAENGDGQAVALTCKAHSGLEARIHNLEGWQEKQNGTLVRLEGKIDRIVWWLLGELAALLIMAAGIWLKG